MLKAVKYKELTQRVSDKTGLDKDMLDSIVIDTFFNLRERMTSFEHLRYNIRGLCVFFYRRTKLDIMSDRLKKVETGEVNLDDIAFKPFMYTQDPVKLREKLNFILNKYDDYLDAKYKIRKENEKIRKSRKDKLEQHKRISTG